MIELSFENIVAFCAAVATVAGAINWILKAVERVKKPNAEQNKRLDIIEKKLIEDKGRLDSLNTRMKGIENSSILTMEAIFALLENVQAKDNPNIQRAKQDIQNYLINKQKWV